MTNHIYRTARDLKRAWWVKALVQSKKDRIELGIIVAEWCERNNVTEKSYWYYHKLLGDELAHTVSEYGSIEKFLPISSCDDSTGKPIFEELRQPGQDSYPEKQKVSAVIHKNGLKIEITDSITDELLIRIIKAVSEPPHKNGTVIKKTGKGMTS